MKLLVCDLDNTLYDWVSYFVPSIYSMILEASKISGIPEQDLIDGLRHIHQKHKDVEHPFSLLETDAIKKRYKGISKEEIAFELNDAFYAFNKTRKRELKLYDNVLPTLSSVRDRNIKIAAHTESRFHSVIDRVTRLGLSEYFDGIYCLERTNFVRPYASAPSTRYYEIPDWKIKELSHHQKKPSREVLLEICYDQGVEPCEAAYIGDSIVRDVAMANSAKVFSIWAKYGTCFDKKLYEKLIKVSHWSNEDIEMEIKLKESYGKERPMVIAEKFSDVLDYL